jgi:hypothetical protein
VKPDPLDNFHDFLIFITNLSSPHAFKFFELLLLLLLFFRKVVCIIRKESFKFFVYIKS